MSDTLSFFLTSVELIVTGEVLVIFAPPIIHLTKEYQCILYLLVQLS